MLQEIVHLAALVPVGLIAAAILVVPGLLVLLPLGTSLPSALVLAPAVGLVPLSVAGVVLAVLDIPWNLTTAALATAVTFGIFWLVGRRFRFERKAVPDYGWLFVSALGAAVAASSLLTVVALHRGMGSVDTASQGWDPIFHMNAVQWIRESGQATPWSVSPIFAAGGSYYPVGWHVVVSLIPDDVVTASNILTLVIGGLLWPAGLAYLASVIFPERRGIWLLAPVLGASYLSFPFAQLMRSGQWPNGLGTALVPAALAILILALRLLRTSHRERLAAQEFWQRRVLPTVLVAVLTLAGAAAAHPGAVMAVAVAAGPFVVAYGVPWLGRAFRHHRKSAVISAIAGVGLFITATAVLGQSRLLESVMSYNRSVRAELPEAVPFAVFDLATFPVLQPPDIDGFNLYVGLLAAVGALACLILRGHRALAVAWIFFVLLHILAAGPENPARWLTGFWYKDTQRIAPMIAMTGALLAAWAVDQLARGTARVVQRAMEGRSARAHRLASGYTAAATALLLIAVIYVASDNFRAAERIAVTARNYSVDASGMGVLTVGEQDFIEEASRLLPDDAVVIGDPFNGETYFYTLGQSRVVYTQLGSATSGNEAKEYLRTSFNGIHSDPAVCHALSTLGATHFYEDQPGMSHASDGLADWPGFYGTDTAQGFEVVHRQGPHTLYKITAC